ncbi:hypothetical protein DIPPA_05402 [Diplonema papillatum]|nr:hypothetical protein DIPPA_05402 [Diplonema papillatum]
MAFVFTPPIPAVLKTPVSSLRTDKAEPDVLEEKKALLTRTNAISDHIRQLQEQLQFQPGFVPQEESQGASRTGSPSRSPPQSPGVTPGARHEEPKLDIKRKQLSIQLGTDFARRQEASIKAHLSASKARPLKVEQYGIAQMITDGSHATQRIDSASIKFRDAVVERSVQSGVPHKMAELLSSRGWLSKVNETWAVVSNQQVESLLQSIRAAVPADPWDLTLVLTLAQREVLSKLFAEVVAASTEGLVSSPASVCRCLIALSAAGVVEMERVHALVNQHALQSRPLPAGPRKWSGLLMPAPSMERIVDCCRVEPYPTSRAGAEGKSADADVKRGKISAVRKRQLEVLLTHARNRQREEVRYHEKLEDIRPLDEAQLSNGTKLGTTPIEPVFSGSFSSFAFFSQAATQSEPQSQTQRSSSPMSVDSATSNSPRDLLMADTASDSTEKSRGANANGTDAPQPSAQESQPASVDERPGLLLGADCAGAAKSNLAGGGKSDEQLAFETFSFEDLFARTPPTARKAKEPGHVDGGRSLGFGRAKPITSPSYCATTPRHLPTSARSSRAESGSCSGDSRTRLDRSFLRSMPLADAQKLDSTAEGADGASGGFNFLLASPLSTESAYSKSPGDTVQRTVGGGSLPKPPLRPSLGPLTSSSSEGSTGKYPPAVTSASTAQPSPFFSYPGGHSPFSSVAELLSSHGLTQYAVNLKENGYDLPIDFAGITKPELVAMGLLPGHAQRLLNILPQAHQQHPPQHSLQLSSTKSSPTLLHLFGGAL